MASVRMSLSAAMQPLIHRTSNALSLRTHVGCPALPVHGLLADGFPYSAADAGLPITESHYSVLDVLRLVGREVHQQPDAAAAEDQLITPLPCAG